MSYELITTNFSIPQLPLYRTTTDIKKRVFACKIETPKFYHEGNFSLLLITIVVCSMSLLLIHILS